MRWRCRRDARSARCGLELSRCAAGAGRDHLAHQPFRSHCPITLFISRDPAPQREPIAHTLKRLLQGTNSISAAAPSAADSSSANTPPAAPCCTARLTPALWPLPVGLHRLCDVDHLADDCAEIGLDRLRVVFDMEPSRGLPCRRRRRLAARPRGLDDDRGITLLRVLARPIVLNGQTVAIGSR
jgi:hypothetical protein